MLESFGAFPRVRATYFLLSCPCGWSDFDAETCKTKTQRNDFQDAGHFCVKLGADPFSLEGLRWWEAGFLHEDLRVLLPLYARGLARIPVFSASPGLPGGMSCF